MRTTLGRVDSGYMSRTIFRSEQGLTIVEVLVAALVLLMGVMGTLSLVQMAGGAANKAKAREGATNVAREILEHSHGLGFSQVGQGGWFTPTLSGLSGRTGTVTSPNAYTQQTAVTRRGVDYTVTTKWCAVDDSRDSYGVHAATSTWCSDSTSTGTADSQPQDLKRLIVDVNWATRGTQQPTVEQVATFTSSGAAVGPQVTALAMQLRRRLRRPLPSSRRTRRAATRLSSPRRLARAT